MTHPKTLQATVKAQEMNEERYRTLFDTHPVGIIYRDADGNITQANPAAIRMLALTRDETNGRIIPNRYWQAVRDDGAPFPSEASPTLIALRTGKPVRDVIMAVSNPEHPTTRWLRITAIPEFQPGSVHPYQAYSVFEDITDRYNAQRQLEKSERQMSIAQRIAGIGSWEWNCTTGAYVCSDEMCRLMGRRPEMFQTTASIMDAIHPDDRPRMKQSLARSISDGAALNQEIRIQLLDGTLRALLVQGEVVQYEGKRPTLMVGIVKDLTEQRRLVSVQDSFSSLFENATEGIFHSAFDGDALRINPALARMFGYATADEMLHALTDIRTQIFAEPAQYDLLVRLIQDNGAVSDFEAQVRHKDGSLFWIAIHARIAAAEDGGIGAYDGFIENITSRKALQAEREHLLREAVQRADYDPLTGLLNHRAFHKRLEDATRQARLGDTTLALILLDLDNFTFFNETFGHTTGDEVLLLVAQRLLEICCPGDIVARYGGDEFALLLPITGGTTLETIEAQITTDLSGLTYHSSGQEDYIPITVSLGSASWNALETIPQNLLPLAEERLQHVKTGGRRETDASLLRHTLHQLVDGFSMLDALVTAVDNKDRYTRRHSEEVMNYSLQIADTLKLDAVQQHTIAVAALLHDVGKIGVPDAILRKPSVLTEAECATIRHHPQMGAAIVAAVPGLEATLDAIRHHHEQWNGGGYPQGLAGNEIPLIARIMAVADAYSAMTSDRPYRAGLPPDVARARLRAGSGTQWDPLIIHAFLTPDIS